MNKDSKIFVAGHKGMVGSAILDILRENDYENLLYRDRSQLDLLVQQDVDSYIKSEKPDIIIDAAARVGGILANNTFPAEFIYQNLTIQSHLIHAAHKYGVKKLLFLGSSCIYPKFATQPLKEEFLLTGPLEPTNEPYAIAKIAGIKMCEYYYKQYGDNFISVMPTNLYGENDSFHLRNSHVLPTVLRKMHLAKLLSNNDTEGLKNDLKMEIQSIDEIRKFLGENGISKDKKGRVRLILWGSGKPKREFLHVNDLADAILFVLININAADLYDDMGISHLNIGTGEDVSISELAYLIKGIVGVSCDIHFDNKKPDGTPRKLLDVKRLHEFGWRHKKGLEDGIVQTYKWYNSIGERTK
jgi:GDP-L-fucose synthase